MAIQVGHRDSLVEECGVAIWRWLIQSVHQRWPGADVRYQAYSGINYRHWRVLLPTGQYFMLAMTEDTLDALGPEAITARLESAGWPDRALKLPTAGVLLTRDGELVSWEPHAGAAKG